MSHTRKDEIKIDGKGEKSEENGKIDDKDFTVDLTGKTLLFGTVNKSVEVKKTFIGSQLSGTADEIIAALSGPKK